MNKKLLLLCALPFLGACDGKFIKKEFLSSECFDGSSALDMKGYTATFVKYGDSYLVVKPTSSIGHSSEFRFVMVPKIRKTGTLDLANVRIKVSSDDDDADTPADWLEKEGDYNDGTLTVCVPTAPTKTSYKYKVTVLVGGKEVGMLDPRADLIPQ